MKDTVEGGCWRREGLKRCECEGRGRGWGEAVSLKCNLCELPRGESVKKTVFFLPKWRGGGV